MKNRSHRCNINKLRARLWHRHTNYKTCVSMMMLICIKQNLSKIWSSNHEKGKQHCGWVKKSVAYKKSMYLVCFTGLFLIHE